MKVVQSSSESGRHRARLRKSISPKLRTSGEYIASSARVSLPEQEFDLPLRLPANVFAKMETTKEDQHMVLQREPNCIKISDKSLLIPDGPFTIEAWVYQTDATGPQAVIAKTQNSEFAIAINKGVPQFDIRIRQDDEEAYVFAKASSAIPTNQWVHLAGVFDEKNAMLFVNGSLTSSMPAVGKRVRNELSTYIGADPDKSDQPNRFFKGKIDEVRFSKTAKYSSDFESQKQLAVDNDTIAKFSFERSMGRYLVDDSPAHLLVEIVGELQLESASR